jgi:hypothetical protein
VLGVLAPASPASAANDFKLDGMSELLWRNINGAITSMWTMNGTAKTAMAGTLRADPNLAGDTDAGLEWGHQSALSGATSMAASPHC